MIPAAIPSTRLTRPTRFRRPVIRMSRPPGHTAAPRRSTARAPGIPPSRDTRKTRRPAATAAAAGQATRTSRPPAITAAAQSGSHRRDPGDFPGEPRDPGIPGSRPSITVRATTAGTGTPATRTSRRPAITAPPSPAATAGQRADTRLTPLSAPIPASRAMRSIRAKRPPASPGLIPPGQIMARALSGMTRPTTPLGDYAGEPEESFPYGPPPGNHDRRDRDRYPGRH